MVFDYCVAGLDSVSLGDARTTASKETHFCLAGLPGGVVKRGRLSDVRDPAVPHPGRARTGGGAGSDALAAGDYRDLRVGGTRHAGRLLAVATAKVASNPGGGVCRIGMSAGGAGARQCVRADVSSGHPSGVCGSILGEARRTREGNCGEGRRQRPGVPYPRHRLPPHDQRCGGEGRDRGDLLNALSHRSGVDQRCSGAAADVSSGRHQ